jgi:hypothetical protein
MKQTALVCTTIGKGDFLDGYCREIAREDLCHDVGIYVVADEKTPAMLWGKCNQMRSKGFSIECATLSQQQHFLKAVNMEEVVPFNSDNRRNYGYLKALADGAEVVVSIDDDNLAADGRKFFQHHGKVGETTKLRQRESTSGWYNVCVDLGMSHVYPRGFPYAHRNGNGYVEEEVELVVDVNQGLWFGEPDIDAHTWVGNPALRVHPERKVTPFFLGQKTWLPINSQNTAVARRAMPAYYFIPMGGTITINGMKMDRMGDIFQGYFLEACVKNGSHGIRIGTPLVEHRRNSHNHSEDMMKEWPGVTMLKDMLPWLQEVKLQRTSYSDAYLSLSDELEYAVESKEWNWPMDARGYFHRVAFCMRQWVKACRMVG